MSNNLDICYRIHNSFISDHCKIRNNQFSDRVRNQIQEKGRHKVWEQVAFNIRNPICRKHNFE